MDGEDPDDAELAAMLEAEAAQRGVVEADVGGTSNDPATRPSVAQISVKVIPFAARDEIVSMSRDGMMINVTAAAEAGSANKAVISLLAGALGVKSYQISLLKGHYKPRKTLQIAGLSQQVADDKLASLS